MLHPIRRTAALSAVLARPAGYPGRISLLLGEGAEVGAYSEDRYDDVDIEWTAGLLSGEVRLDCEEGYQWLRSGRRSEEHTSELQSLMRISYAVFCLKKKN